MQTCLHADEVFCIAEAQQYMWRSQISQKPRAMPPSFRSLHRGIRKLHYRSNHPVLHAILDIIAHEDIPRGTPAVRREELLSEPHGSHVLKTHPFHGSLTQGVEDEIIAVKSGMHLLTEPPAAACHTVMELVLAGVAAELLVRPSISDPVPAFQTQGMIVFFSDFV